MPARRVRVRGRRGIPGPLRAADGRCSWRPTIAGRPQPLQCEPMQEFDFAIVGAGIAGVSLAYHLAPQAKVIILEREHVPAYHTTGRSAALHSETYGCAEIRAITVAAGHFYRKPPDGLHRSSAADAARRAARRPRRAGSGRAQGGRGVRQAGAERALARAGRGAAPPALAAARGLRRRRGVRGGRGHGRRGDPCRLPQGRAGGRRRAAARRGGHGARPRGRPLDDQAARRRDRSPPTNLVNAAGAWADVVAGLAGAKPVGLVPKRRTAFTFDAPAGLGARAACRR